MSEINKRFSALLDNNNDRNFKKNQKQEKYMNSNSFKSESKHTKRYDKNTETYLNRNDNLFSQFLRKDNIKEKIHMYNAIENLNDFPILLEEKSYKEYESKQENINFLNALNNNEIKIETQTKNIPDGWVISKFDEKSRKIIKEYGKNTYINKNLTSLEIMEMIAYKYYVWEKKYIDTWGQDEYEKMYKFSNYDYNYFDKLDEKYEEEMEIYYRENNYDSSYSNSDYETNDDYYEY